MSDSTFKLTTWTVEEIRQKERARLLAALPAFIPTREFEGSTGDFWANGFNTCLVRVRRLLEIPTQAEDHRP